MFWHICCAGKMSRWNNYLGLPKHLVEINGETLIKRMTRLVKLFDINPYINIYVSKLDNRYKIKETNLVIIKLNNNEHIDKILPIKTILPYSSKDEPNIMLFGDIYFTKNAIKEIYNISKISTNINFFGRETGSRFTLCEWGEIWSVSYYHDHIKKIMDSIIILEKKYKQNEIKRVKHWELYRLLNEISLKRNNITKNFIKIDDFTEDFDFPIDYDRWIKQYELYKQNNNI